MADLSDWEDAPDGSPTAGSTTGSTASWHPLSTAFCAEPEEERNARLASETFHAMSMSPRLSPKGALSDRGSRTHFSERGSRAPLSECGDSVSVTHEDRTAAMVSLLAPPTNLSDVDTLALLRQQLIMERTERQDDDCALRADLKMLQIRMDRAAIAAPAGECNQQPQQPPDSCDLDRERTTVATIHHLWQAHKALEQKVDGYRKTVAFIADQMVEQKRAKPEEADELNRTQKLSVTAMESMAAMSDNRFSLPVALGVGEGKAAFGESMSLDSNGEPLKGARYQSELLAGIEQVRIETKARETRMEHLESRFAKDNKRMRSQFAELICQVQELKDGLAKHFWDSPVKKPTNSTNRDDAPNATQKQGSSTGFLSNVVLPVAADERSDSKGSDLKERPEPARLELKPTEGKESALRISPLVSSGARKFGPQNKLINSPIIGQPRDRGNDVVRKARSSTSGFHEGSPPKPKLFPRSERSEPQLPVAMDTPLFERSQNKGDPQWRRAYPTRLLS